MKRQYRYKAFDAAEAAWQRGIVTASNATEAATQLRGRGWQVARLERDYRIPWQGRQWSKRQTAFLATQLATLLTADIDLIRALDMLAGTYGGGRREVLAQAAAQIRLGKSAAEALTQAGVFPFLFVRLADVGERSGMLAENLQRAAAYFETQDRADRAWQEALAYPLLVSMLAAAVTGIFMTVVLPTFARLFAELDVTPSATTVWILQGGTWLAAAWPWLAVAATGVLLIGGLTGKYPPWQQRRRAFIWRWKPHRYRSLSVLCHVWSAVLYAGIDVAQGLDIAGETLADSACGIRLKRAGRQVLQGSAPHRALRACGIEDELLLHMVEVGTETGRLPELLQDAGSFYDEQIAELTQRYKAYLGPAVLVAVGGIVAAVMYGMLMPILDAITTPLNG